MRKDQTNTPLQALTLMNNVAFVEAARFLAERMLQEGGTQPADRITHGFRLMLGRAPDAEELESLSRTFNSVHGHFDRDRDAALKLLSIGERSRDKTLDPADHAALTIVGNVILNLDETITLE